MNIMFLRKVDHRLNRHLVIGMGEIGSSLYRVLQSKRVKVFSRDLEETSVNRADVLHITFPYSSKFIKQVQDYMEQYDPYLVFVYSTVPIGTCEEISEQVVHSPVEGRHPKLEQSILSMPRWIGVANAEAEKLAAMFWVELLGSVRVMPSSRHTEFLKLRSTAKYGINLVWTDYEASIANDIGIDWAAVKDFDHDYNDLYGDLGWSQFKRYILDPPNGVIGGHCVVPNAELLDKQYPNPMLKMIKKMRGKKK